MIEYRPLEADSARLPEVLALLRRVFPRAAHFTPEYMDWMYLQNPLGRAMGSNAYAEGRLIGHVAAQRLMADLDGRPEAGILIHNVCTDPLFQGRGVFSRLLRECLEVARSEGCSHMVAVPNLQSTPGFLRSLGCQSLGMLQARLGIGPLPAVRGGAPNYRRSWDSAQLAWRLGGPGKVYHCSRPWVIGSTGIPGIGAALGVAEYSNGPKCFRPLTLWVGLSPRLNWNWRPYFDIPLRLRPAPLNLVFLDLTSQRRTVERSRVEFSALDFDIY